MKKEFYIYLFMGFILINVGIVIIGYGFYPWGAESMVGASLIFIGCIFMIFSTYFTEKKKKWKNKNSYKLISFSINGFLCPLYF